MGDPGQYLDLLVTVGKTFVEYVKLKGRSIKSTKCHDIILKHTNMISDLISRIGQTTGKQLEVYYNLILMLEQTIARLSEICY